MALAISHIIIQKTVSFSCFSGIAHGTVSGQVTDNGTNTFPTHITVNSNLGSGSFNIDLKGNETIKEKIQGIDVEITVSDWKVDQSTLSFHLKAVAKKKVLFTLSCTVVDESFKGNRHNAQVANERLIALNNQLETFAKSQQKSNPSLTEISC
jgi:hypothetical protein